MYRLCLIYLVVAAFVGCSSSVDGPNGNGQDKGIVQDKDLALVTFVTEDVVSPRLESMNTSVDLLQTSFRAACGGTPLEVEKMRVVWRKAMGDFHYLEAMAFGPLNPSENSDSQFMYSMPVHGSDQLIESEIQKANQLGQKYKMNRKKDFLLGFDAIEYVLFGALKTQSHLFNESVECDYLLYVGQDLQVRVNRVWSRWQKEELEYLKTPEGKTRIREYVAKITDSLFFADTALKDRKLMASLGMMQDKFPYSPGF